MRPLWTPEEAAAYLNRSVNTLHYWRNCSPPKGPAFIRQPKQVRYRPEAVEAWLEANTTETAA